MTQYRWIYLLHMPLFCFLSGLFLERCESCIRQLRRMFPLYLFMQFAAVFFGNGSVKLLTPYWHLWYLLSYCTWTGIAWLWFRFCKGRGKMLILAVAIFLGCAAGYVSSVGREHSLSRSLVFFPYFWMGLICDPKFPWQKLRLIGLTALGLAIAIMANTGNHISVVFLYHAAPFGTLQNGFMLRLICYLLGALLCLFLLSFIPTKRLPFSKAGSDTMPAYLLHVPLVLYLRELEIPWGWYPLITAAILYGFYKMLQWHSAMYGIVSSERRGSEWPHFMKSTKNTRSRSIDSCYP